MSTSESAREQIEYQKIYKDIRNVLSCYKKAKGFLPRSRAACNSPSVLEANNADVQ
jgi:hypothetical protein